MTKFKLHLETLDARIVPDATPTTSIPIPPPSQGGIDPQIWQQMVIAAQQRIDAAKVAYLNALIKVEADIAAIDAKLFDLEILNTGLTNAKAAVAGAAAADKPALQEMVDLWQLQIDGAMDRLRDLVYQYRDDRAVAAALGRQLIMLSPTADVPNINDDRFNLEPEIDELIPRRVVPINSL